MESKVAALKHRTSPTKPAHCCGGGYALAGGAELALAADLIVAARDSAFGFLKSSGSGCRRRGFAF